MIGKWIPLSLILLASYVHAENQRKEPSLLLEYERELKKTNDAQKETENPFTRNGPLLSVSKPVPPVVPTVNQVAFKEPKKLNADTVSIGQDTAPFLVVNKPAPVTSSALCPDEKSQAIGVENSAAIVQNLKSAKNKVLAKAKEFLGTPYGFGNKSNDRTDCSGFTQQVYSQFGISLPRSAAEQAQLGVTVDPNDLQIGDLLFYRTYKSDPSHVAIYAGNGQIIHASYNAHKVQFDSIDKGYYKERFLYAKRLAFNDNGEDN